MRALRPTVIAVLALAMLTPATSWAGLYADRRIRR